MWNLGDILYFLILPRHVFFCLLICVTVCFCFFNFVVIVVAVVVVVVGVVVVDGIDVLYE